MKTCGNLKKLLLPACLGGAIGVINGFFGGGGGMVAVPALERAYGQKSKNSHATSIAVILPVSVASAVVYLTGGGVDYLMLGVCTLGSSVGGILGSFALKKAANRSISAIFCIVMLAAGIRMLF